MQCSTDSWEVPAPPCSPRCPRQCKFQATRWPVLWGHKTLGLGPFKCLTHLHPRKATLSPRAFRVEKKAPVYTGPRSSRWHSGAVAGAAKELNHFFSPIQSCTSPAQIGQHQGKLWVVTSDGAGSGRGCGGGVSPKGCQSQFTQGQGAHPPIPLARTNPRLSPIVPAGKPLVAVWMLSLTAFMLASQSCPCPRVSWTAAAWPGCPC